MTTIERRELEAWISMNVTGLKYATEIALHRPTENPAAAMALLEKCAEIGTCEVYFGTDGLWHVDSDSTYEQSKIREKADTLPLAICLFAKKLFEK